jgi:hypothetical protein
MKRVIFVFFLLALSVNSYSAPLVIDPGSALLPDSGPFGYGGRGVVFRAEQDFSMSSFGMDLNFPGTLDFHVSVYAVSDTSRGALISETAYPGMTDDGSEFFTLAHTQNFTAGNVYEIILRFSDPGVIFPHYDFNNPSLSPASGFTSGPNMLVLDGSDFDAAEFGNTWLARFQLDGETGTPVYEQGIPVPTLNSLGLILLILVVLSIAIRSRKFVS